MSEPKIVPEFISAAAEAALAYLSARRFLKVEFKGPEPSVSDFNSSADSAAVWEAILDGFGKKDGGITPGDVTAALDELCRQAEQRLPYTASEVTDRGVVIKTLIRNDGPR